MAKFPGRVRATQNKQKGDESAGYVQAVESGGQVESRAVHIRRQGQVFIHQGGVFINLTTDEDGA